MKEQGVDPRLEAFKRLLDIMDELREKCPWDRKQTMESLRYLTIEETYELSDAVLDNDMEEVRKELGDLMLHLAFYSKIGSEKGAFDITDVLNGICEKLIVRHPHIYGDQVAETEEDVMKNWELIKLKEKDNKRKTTLGGVPKSLPAMIKAFRIQEKARGVGFDWENRDQVWAKVEEELQEFKDEYNDGDVVDQSKAESEFGDLLFSLINYSRFVNINPETALELTNKKFIKRFNYLENRVAEDGKEFGKISLEEMDKYWEESKKLDVESK